MILRTERFIKVKDNWYPNFPGNRVKIILSLNYYKNYYIKLAAWGADDTAYEIEFDYNSVKDAIKGYYNLLPFYQSIPDGITKDWFIDRGFTRF